MIRSLDDSVSTMGIFGWPFVRLKNQIKRINKSINTGIKAYDKTVIV